ncbi:hypothetical protein BWI97_08775 [Siphonobacter sp. BAB-5405]|uniref:hypothetical protein n=1 Tax=Siphonobacter sp. BAB-5405 TaxID=1864825 RepID=UPI000C7FCD61|nr:hypothetical protein [Siphonobacter sp. BAB-5405]PMD97693.1 hypothetical protein BWI97_08775 [Siphonobacter sp. BAB-5405]
MNRKSPDARNIGAKIHRIFQTQQGIRKVNKLFPHCPMLLPVPVKAHVKEFFQSSQVLGKEPIEIRRNHRLGQIICAVFCSYPLIEDDREEEDLEPIYLLDPDYLNLVLKFKINPALITDDRLMVLGQMLEVVYEFYAIAFVNGRMSIFPSLNGAAEWFTKTHNLKLNSYSSDAVRKLVDRTKTKRLPIHDKLSVVDKNNVSNYREKVSNFA